MNYVNCSKSASCSCSNGYDSCQTGCCAPNITINVPATPTTPTTAYLNAQNNVGSAIAVVTTGTVIPLAGNQLLNGFTANAAGNTFTVTNTGTYLLTYTINLREESTASARIIRNGTELAGTVYDPATTTDEYQVTTIVNLNAGDTISLQLYGETSTVILQTGVGASLTLVKIA